MEAEIRSTTRATWSSSEADAATGTRLDAGDRLGRHGVRGARQQERRAVDDGLLQQAAAPPHADDRRRVTGRDRRAVGGHRLVELGGDMGQDLVAAVGARSDHGARRSLLGELDQGLGPGRRRVPGAAVDRDRGARRRRGRGRSATACWESSSSALSMKTSVATHHPNLLQDLDDLRRRLGSVPEHLGLLARALREQRAGASEVSARAGRARSRPAACAWPASGRAPRGSAGG